MSQACDSVKAVLLLCGSSVINIFRRVQRVTFMEHIHDIVKSDSASRSFSCILVSHRFNFLVISVDLG